MPPVRAAPLQDQYFLRRRLSLCSVQQSLEISRSSARRAGARRSVRGFPRDFHAWLEICWRPCRPAAWRWKTHSYISVFASRAEIFSAEVRQMKRGAGTWCIGLSAILCVILTAGWASAQNAQGLAAVGAADPANGYPKWYIDRNGLQLAPCLDNDANDSCGLAGTLPNNAAPVSFPNNFPDEFFYSLVNATID